jgi:hypothetical protein
MDAIFGMSKFLQQTLTPFYKKYKIEYRAGLFTLYMCLKGTQF